MLIRHLTEIVDGLPGYAELSRAFWRLQGAGDFIVDGNTKTCMVDALIVCGRNIGATIVKSEVYAALFNNGDQTKPPTLAEVKMYAFDTVSWPSALAPVDAHAC
jgi:hypothetical protein